MKVTFYGVRGSTPCDGQETAAYGGNTSCAVVSVPDHPPVLLDLGTGLRYFGRECAHDGSFHAACLLSHLHWDHIQGLPFFSPLLCSGAHLDVYAPAQSDGRTVAEVIDATIRPPLFPVHLDELPGHVEFHDLDGGEFMIGDIKVLARPIPHVGRTFGYRMEWQGHSLAYLPDHQQPYDGSFAVEPEAFELVDGVDLLIHDSQFTPAEFVRKFDWGHCTSEYAIWLAGRARVKQLALFHHDPNRTDAALTEYARCASGVAAQLGVELLIAAEGLTVDLGRDSDERVLLA